MLIYRRSTPKARASLLRSLEDQFGKSDESAHSIDSVIPSQLSVSTSQRHSLTDSTLESLDYHPLSFENKLLMSKVYIRNSKNMMIKKIFKIRSQSKEKGKELIKPVLDWEAIRNELDADSLLHSSPAMSIEDDDTMRPYVYLGDRGVSSQPLDILSIPGQESTALLIRACEQGNCDLVKDLLSGGVDIHAPFTRIIYSGYKAIHVAALYGHVNVVQVLLDSGANIDETDAIKWRRPLHFAAGSRQTSMIRFLLGKGARVDAMTRNAVQPIHEAAWSGSIEALDALIEAGAPVDCPDLLGYQPLHWATLTPNQPEIIKYLSNKNADINAKTSQGLRAVQLVSKADAANLGMLLALDAKTDYDDGTTSALITAIDNHCRRSVEMLLKHGVDPNLRASDGSTALHSLARLRAKSFGEPSNDKEICRLLLDHGANVNIKDTNGYQVLHCLAGYDSALTADAAAVEVLAKLVLERGADLDATVSQGWSALYLAIYHGNHQLSRLLIRSGSRVLARTDALCLDLQVITLGSQRTRYTVTVSHNIPGSAGSVKDVLHPHLPLSVDDDGFNVESALKRTLVNLQKHHAHPKPRGTQEQGNNELQAPLNQLDWPLGPSPYRPPPKDRNISRQT